MPTTIARPAIFDALIDAVDTVRALNRARPSRLARIEDAWGWLLQQDVYHFEGDELLIASISEPGIVRRASWQGCTCPSRVGCYHVEAASLIGRAQRYGAIDRSRPALPFTPELYEVREKAPRGQEGKHPGFLCSTHQTEDAAASAWRRLEAKNPGEYFIVYPKTSDPDAFACARGSRYSRADDPRVSAEELVADLFS